MCGRTGAIAGVLLAEAGTEYNPEKQVWNEVKNNASEAAGENKEDLKARPLPHWIVETKQPAYYFFFHLPDTKLRRVSLISFGLYN